ncbi:MAG: hypothetical protein AB7R40_26555 [Nitrospiraceae bacterium]
MAEYNYGKPVALVEYKDRRYSAANTSNRTYDALKALANGYSPGAIPFLIAVYCPDDWWFVVHPMNAVAEAHYRHCAGKAISEQRFVKSLYMLRKSVLTVEDEKYISMLNTTMPQVNV